MTLSSVAVSESIRRWLRDCAWVKVGVGVGLVDAERGEGPGDPANWAVVKGWGPGDPANWAVVKGWGPGDPASWAVVRGVGPGDPEN